MIAAINSFPVAAALLLPAMFGLYVGWCSIRQEDRLTTKAMVVLAIVIGYVLILQCTAYNYPNL